MNVADLLEGKRVCVCGGSGGVGKTTTSAAIALGMAAAGGEGRGRDDRSRQAAGQRARPRGARERAAPGRARAPRRRRDEVRGELWAMMLDPKRTFDELIDRVAPSAERAAGDQGATASTASCRPPSRARRSSPRSPSSTSSTARGDFDLLVLDTPPSRNALDFLDAPGRLTSFLEGRALKAFIRPTGLGMRVLGRGAAPLLGALRRVTGVDLITDLSTFFALLGDMTEDFSDRAAQVERMLQGRDDRVPARHLRRRATAIDEAIWFRRTLPRRRAAVRRRDRQPRPPRPARRRASRRIWPTRSTGELGAELAARVADNLDDYHVLARRDARNVARLRAGARRASRCCSSRTSTTTCTTSTACCGAPLPVRLRRRARAADRRCGGVAVRPHDGDGDNRSTEVIGRAAGALTVVVWSSAFIAIRYAPSPVRTGRARARAAARRQRCARRADADRREPTAPSQHLARDRRLRRPLVRRLQRRVERRRASRRRRDRGAARQRRPDLHRDPRRRGPQGGLSAAAAPRLHRRVRGRGTDRGRGRRHHVGAGWGIALCFIAALSYAVGVIAQKPVLAHASSLSVTWLACTIGAVLLPPVRARARPRARPRDRRPDAVGRLPRDLPDNDRLPRVGLRAVAHERRTDGVADLPRAAARADARLADPLGDAAASRDPRRHPMHRRGGVSPADPAATVGSAAEPRAARRTETARQPALGPPDDDQVADGDDLVDRQVRA